jgi:nucleoid-associated protein YgaU
VWTSPKPLAPGSYAVTLEAAPATGGAAVTSDQAVAVVLPDRPDTPLVVLTTPQQPSQVIQKPGSAEVAAATPPAQPAPGPAAPAAPAPAQTTVSLDSVDYNDQGDIVFSGRGAPGSTVRLYVDNDFTGDAVVSPEGAWSWSGKGGIAPGQHTLRADQLGTDAKVSSRVELPFVRAEPKQVAAAQAAEPAAPAPQPAPAQATAAAQPQPAPAAEPAAPQPGRIVIQPGNNLWNISRVLYGKGTQYTVIYEANKDLIRNPSMIYPGQVFTTPGTSAPTVIDPKWRKPLSEVTGAQGAGQSQN